MDKIKKETTEETCAVYRCQIIQMVEKIENQKTLMKIYTVVKTHFKILKEKEQS